MIKDGVELKTIKMNYGEPINLSDHLGELMEYPNFVIRYEGTIPEEVPQKDGGYFRQTKMVYTVFNDKVDRVLSLNTSGLLPELFFKLNGQIYVYDHNTVMKGEDFGQEIRPEAMYDMDEEDMLKAAKQFIDDMRQNNQALSERANM